MPNKGPLGFQRFTSLFMNIFIGIVLGLVLLFLSHDVTAMSGDEIARAFCQSLIMSVLVGYAVGDFLPTMTLAQKIIAALKVQNRLLQHLITSLTLAIVNVTIILSICMFIVLLANMPVPGVLEVIAMLWLPAVVAGFIAIFITLPLAQKLASKASGFDPADA